MFVLLAEYRVEVSYIVVRTVINFARNARDDGGA